jgi:hypothetical protein
MVNRKFQTPPGPEGDELAVGVGWTDGVAVCVGVGANDGDALSDGLGEGPIPPVGPAFPHAAAIGMMAIRVSRTRDAFKCFAPDRGVLL